MKAPLKDKGLFVQLLVLVALMIVSAGVFIIGFTLIFKTGYSINGLKALQVIQTIAVFCLPCVACAFLFSQTPATYLSLNKHAGLKSSIAVILTMLLAQPAINLVGHLNEQIALPESLSALEQMLKEMEDNTRLLLEKFMQTDNIGGLIVNLFVIAALPAFAEELCFRGTLQQMFSRHGSAVVAIWACAILFSAAHFQFYGFVPRMLIGAFLGYLLLWSGSLWLPVIAHLTNNATIVILYYVFQQKKLSTEMLDSLGTGETLWLGISCLVLVIPAVYLCRRIIKSEHSQTA